MISLCIQSQRFALEHPKVRQWEAQLAAIFRNGVAESGALVEKFLVSHGPSKIERRPLGGSGDSLSFSPLSLNLSTCIRNSRTWLIWMVFFFVRKSVLVCVRPLRSPIFRRRETDAGTNWFDQTDGGSISALPPSSPRRPRWERQTDITLCTPCVLL